KSCREVKALIEFLKPQVVFLELCSSRRSVLRATEKIKVPTMAKMVDVWKKNQNPFGILFSLFLVKAASKLEVVPGAEFRVAYEEAVKYGGKVILGDRPVQITLQRTWAAMSLWHKTKLIYSLLFLAIFFPSTENLIKMLKESDDTELVKMKIYDADWFLQEMSKRFPTLVKHLVHERDQYMSATILRVARGHNSVVAVVGKGHLVGIQKNWKQPVDLKQLLSMPSEKKRIPVGKILTSIGATVAIISGIYHSSKK
ncbi:TraB family protein, partial [Perilla frutescens var. frutescens]